MELDQVLALRPVGALRGVERCSFRVAGGGPQACTAYPRGGTSIGGDIMTTSLNPAAPHHLPMFITAPGDTDVLMVVTAIFLLVSVVTFGLVFFRLHTLPERMAHGANKLQFEIVAVLGLLALFTHNHAFWVAGLFLALIDIPDFPGWLGRIARGVERIAGIKPEEIPAEVAAHGDHGGAAAKNATAIPDRTRGGSPKKEELIDA
jgi:hypothetical protein